MVFRAGARPKPGPAPVIISGGRWSVVKQEGSEVVCRLVGRPGETVDWNVTTPMPLAAAELDGAPAPGAAGKDRFNLKIRFPGKLEAFRCAPLKMDNGRNGAPTGVQVSLPKDCRESRLALLIRGKTKVMPFRDIRLDGAPVKAQHISGQGWTFLLIALPAGEHRVTWRLPDTSKPNTPFSAPAASVQARLFARRILPARELVLRFTGKMPIVPVPPTPFAAVDPVSLPVLSEFKVLVSRSARRPVSAAEFARIRAAKLHLLLFDVNGEKQYADKWILLNGVRIARVPANRAPIARWQEWAVDIPKALLHVLKRTGNQVVLTNAGGDCYKVTDIALAVQLSDGSWAESDHDGNVYSSVRSWQYFEGRPFKKDRIPSAALSFAGGGR